MKFIYFFIVLNKCVYTPHEKQLLDFTLGLQPGPRRIRQRSYSERSEAITSRGWDSPPAQRDLVGRIWIVSEASV